MRDKKNTCVIPTGSIDPKKAAFQDLYSWDEELSEVFDNAAAQEPEK